MPDLTLPTASPGTENAADWVNRNLGRVLGLGPAMLALPRDRLAEGLDARKREVLAEAIGRRFRRSLDDATGKVAFEVLGAGAAVAAGDDEDPELKATIDTYLTAARKALRSVDVTLCRPDVCPDDLTALINQAVAGLERLGETAARRGGVPQAFIFLHELGEGDHRGGGVLSQIRALIDTCDDGDPAPSVAHEKSLRAFETALRALCCFREGLCAEIRAADGIGMAEFWGLVTRCGPEAAEHMQALREVFAEIGVGECELDRYEVRVPRKARSGFVACGVETVGFGGLLRALEAEPHRWVTLARPGTLEQRNAVMNSANVLRRLLGKVRIGRLAKRLSLADGDAARVKTRFRRAEGFARALFELIVDGRPGPDPTDGAIADEVALAKAAVLEAEPPAPKPKRGRDKPVSTSDDDDQKPIE